MVICARLRRGGDVGGEDGAGRSDFGQECTGATGKGRIMRELITNYAATISEFIPLQILQLLPQGLSVIRKSSSPQ